ncbi:AFG1 family ATPase [Thioalkalivibrio sulfidiphilus HL-EbGr7]|uniref:Cell division protein ZapE n=1 Tax=Thioalkalivibrio sulfidiphilus (strain HL-EbGR7) TaxID=396588 RepID=B8GRX0_THISH|nr:cell division protein ZapE [Thioalkalivibrio sulfidiphilus]ACL72674.1 AFG1 family ATPase [Thioalkalivibrio sulfidiphilus HL-EbGr7]
MPYQRYLQDVERRLVQPDPAQDLAMQGLQRVRDQIMAPAPRAGLMDRLLGRRSARVPVRGFYLWGGVGRGKTYLVDTFFDALPFENKLRLHFHRFMQRVHGELKTLKQTADPIDIVAKRLAQARVMCLDEFYVSDITDAMLLHRLLAGMFAEGMTLVTTSNTPPDDLYKNGLHRHLFLPAIELIKQHLEVFHLDSPVDYRLRSLEQAEIYHAPLDEAAVTRLTEAFRALAPEPGSIGGSLEVAGRQIPVQRLADGVVWFRFPDICDGPRSQLDYVEIARMFHTVLVSDIPVMDESMENQARRFMALVDEFYDRKVKLIVSAEASADQLYQGKWLPFEFQRTLSRLREMQSHAYLEQPHLP